MNAHIETALRFPVFDPERQIDGRFFWWAERSISAGLTFAREGPVVPELKPKQRLRFGESPFHQLLRKASA
jgi:hypothetical protein